MSIERKLRRAQAKKEKKLAEKELGIKVALFGKLGNKCLTCEKPFDKMDREQVMSWNVVVKNETETVRLYCPQCWDNAVNLIKEAKQELLKRKGED
jgi:Zn finger protein HypA/HybF involved in hydrogenase expression